MKKLLLIAGLLLLGSNFANAQEPGQTVRVPGRATSHTETTTTTEDEKGIKTTTITSHTECDGIYQNDTCYNATNNGETGTIKGRNNWTVEIIGGHNGIQHSVLKGNVQSYLIDDASAHGGIGSSTFIFIQ